MKIEERGFASAGFVLMIDFEGPAGTAVIDAGEAFKNALRSLRPGRCGKARRAQLVGVAISHGWNVARAFCKWAGLDPDALVYGPDCGDPDCGSCCINHCGNDSPRAGHCGVCARKAV